MAAIANLIIDQGCTFSSNVSVKDGDGVAFNLTGYTVLAKMALGFSSTRSRTTITSTVASDATTGVITLTLTPAQTAVLDAPARYLYDIEITLTATGTVTRVIEGLITTRPQVSI